MLSSTACPDYSGKSRLSAAKTGFAGKKLISILFFLFTYGLNVLPQDITSTLAPGGDFIIKDSSNIFLSLEQSDGQLNLFRSLWLENTTEPNLGVIFKGDYRFLHDYGTNNIFIGTNSGNFTMTGFGRNISLGSHSLLNNITGHDNIAVGQSALTLNTIGNDNIAIGTNALYFNSTGVGNTAVGFQCLSENTTGEDNTAIGRETMYFNTTGNNNTAVGSRSLNHNTTGSYNTALGYHCLAANDSGGGNTAIGYFSLNQNTTGGSNTAIGDNSLYQNTTGSNNTALGNFAGFNVTSGNNLMCLGNNAQPTTGDAVNQITLGDGNITSLRCNVTTISSLSDIRDKKNVKDLELGIDFLMKIKPRQFNWDRREWYENNISDGSKINELPTAGFIAQELDEAQTRAQVEWLNLVLKDNPEKWEATPGNLLPIIVKAIQQLKEENEQLKLQLAAIGNIKQEISELEFLKRELKEQIKILKTWNDTKEVKITSLRNEGIVK